MLTKYVSEQHNPDSANLKEVCTFCLIRNATKCVHFVFVRELMNLNESIFLIIFMCKIFVSGKFSISIKLITFLKSLGINGINYLFYSCAIFIVTREKMECRCSSHTGLYRNCLVRIEHSFNCFNKMLYRSIVLGEICTFRSKDQNNKICSLHRLLYFVRFFSLQNNGFFPLLTDIIEKQTMNWK